MIQTKPAFFLLIFLMAIMLLPSTVKASPDTEDLYVNAFDSTYLDWDEVNNSPYLHDSDGDYVNCNTNNAFEGNWTFATSSGVGTINFVYLYFECMQDSGGDETFECFLYEGVSWESQGEILPNVGSYTWQYFDVSTKLDSWGKIDVAEIYLVLRKGSAGTKEVYVRRCYIHVDYEGATLHIADLDQSISTTNTVLTQWDAIADFSQSITSSYDLVTKWDAIADFSQSISTTWQVLASHGMFVDMTQGITTAWDFLTDASYNIEPSQSLTTTWEVLTDTDYNILPSQSITSTWNMLTETSYNIIPSLSVSWASTLEVILQEGGGTLYIVDLTQSISTTWEFLTQWDAIADLGQSISTTWAVIIDHITPESGFWGGPEGGEDAKPSDYVPEDGEPAPKSVLDIINQFTWEYRSFIAVGAIIFCIFALAYYTTRPSKKKTEDRLKPRGQPRKTQPNLKPRKVQGR